MPPRRQPTDTVQVNLRIKESERRQLAAAAEANDVSLNAEMAHRLAQSFEQRTLLSIRQTQEDLETFLLPMLSNFHELQQQETLAQAVGKLVDRLQPLLAAKVIDGPEGERIKRDIGEIRAAIRVIELEWNRRRPGGPAEREWRRGLPGGSGVEED